MHIIFRDFALGEWRHTSQTASILPWQDKAGEGEGLFLYVAPLTAAACFDQDAVDGPSRSAAVGAGAKVI